MSRRTLSGCHASLRRALCMVLSVLSCSTLPVPAPATAPHPAPIPAPTSAPIGPKAMAPVTPPITAPPSAPPAGSTTFLAFLDDLPSDCSSRRRRRGGAMVSEVVGDCYIRVRGSGVAYLDGGLGVDLGLLGGGVGDLELLALQLDLLRRVLEDLLQHHEVLRDLLHLGVAVLDLERVPVDGVARLELQAIDLERVGVVLLLLHLHLHLHLHMFVVLLLLLCRRLERRVGRLLKVLELWIRGAARGRGRHVVRRRVRPGAAIVGLRCTHTNAEHSRSASLAPAAVRRARCVPSLLANESRSMR